MSEEEIIIDKFVQESEGFASVPVISSLPFEKPMQFKDIPDDVVKRVGLYLAPIINIKSKNREVNIIAIINNAKALFVNGRYHYDKDYWLQHCASSFREIILFVEPSNFSAAHRNIPDPDSPEIEKAFAFIVNSVTYLSSVVHHRPAQLMGDAEKLYPNQGFGQMTRSDFSAQEAIFLERLCVDIVYTLDHVFCTYCASKV
ncbi:MAG: hypothetical protein WCG01_05515 [bacterium]